MKKTTTVFTCDYCETSTQPLEHFPYESGWHFLYNLQLKINDKFYEIKDTHFCSKECCLAFLNQAILNPDKLLKPQKSFDVVSPPPVAKSNIQRRGRK